jgi:quercetin dioxygenase-like cupin family protein
MIRLELIPWSGSATPGEAELRRLLVADGYDVMAWSDPPRRTYAPHSHDHDESLWCVRGSIRFEIAGTSYPLRPGDRLMLPRGTVHAAEAGDDGATYLIGEK